MICAIYRVPRSPAYEAGAVAAPVVVGKRGPKTPVTAGDLVVAIRGILAACPFHGEGTARSARASPIVANP
jgi:hypothetical protein